MQSSIIGAIGGAVGLLLLILWLKVFAPRRAKKREELELALEQARIKAEKQRNNEALVSILRHLSRQPMKIDAIIGLLEAAGDPMNGHLIAAALHQELDRGVKSRVINQSGKGFLLNDKAGR